MLVHNFTCTICVGSGLELSTILDQDEVGGHLKGGDSGVRLV